MDATQSVFLTIHLRLASFEGRSPLRSWIFGICMRVASDHRRSAPVRREVITDHIDLNLSATGHDADPLVRAESRQAAAIAESILNQRPEEQRVAFVLFELEEMSAEEIATLVDVPVGTMRCRRGAGLGARIYEAVVSGRWAPGQRQAAPVTSTPFDEVAARWLAHIRPSIEEKTFRLYRDTYVGSHFASFFKTIEQLTTVGAQDYIAGRLRKVTRQTLKHELSPLRRLAKWAHARGYLRQMPEIETPGRRVLGTPVANARKRNSLIFTANEIAAIVARLPVYWSAPRAQAPTQFAPLHRGLGDRAATAHARQAGSADGLPPGRNHAAHPRRGRQEPFRPRAAAHRGRACRARQRLPGRRSHLRQPRLHHAAPARREGRRHRRLPRRSHLGLRLPPFGGHAPWALVRQPAGRDVPARSQAAGDDRALHAAAARRCARSAARSFNPRHHRATREVIHRFWPNCGHRLWPPPLNRPHPARRNPERLLSCARRGTRTPMAVNR